MASLTAAPFLFPAEVAFWFAPGDRPDVVVSSLHAVAWLTVGYVVLAAVAWTVASSLSSLAGAFSGRPGPSSAPHVLTAGVLAAGTVQVWLVVGYGNDSVRPWLELCLQVALLTGALAVAAIRMAPFLRSDPTVHPGDNP